MLGLGTNLRFGVVGPSQEKPLTKVGFLFEDFDCSNPAYVIDFFLVGK